MYFIKILFYYLLQIEQHKYLIRDTKTMKVKKKNKVFIKSLVINMNRLSIILLHKTSTDNWFWLWTHRKFPPSSISSLEQWTTSPLETQMGLLALLTAALSLLTIGKHIDASLSHKKSTDNGFRLWRHGKFFSSSISSLEQGTTSLLVPQFEFMAWKKKEQILLNKELKTFTHI